MPDEIASLRRGFEQAFPAEYAELIARLRRVADGGRFNVVNAPRGPRSRFSGTGRSADDAVAAFFADVLPRTEFGKDLPFSFNGSSFRIWYGRDAPHPLRGVVELFVTEMRALCGEFAAPRLAAAQEAARREVKARQLEAESRLASESSLVSRFCEVAYRKVRALDEYGDEQWDAVDREIDVVIGKLRRKHPDWRLATAPRDRSKFAMLSWEQKHGEDLRERLKLTFQSYYDDRRASGDPGRPVDGLTGREFEAWLMDELVRKGATDVRGTPATGDQGGDVLFTFSGRRVVVQCKRYSGNVGNAAVQEVHAAKGFYGCESAWVVTNSTFTPAARALAASVGVTLVGRDLLHQLDVCLGKLGI